MTGYNSLSATSDLKMADYDIPVYPGTMRYNPQVKDHGIIIGYLIFHGLLMHSLTHSRYVISTTAQPLIHGVVADIQPGWQRTDNDRLTLTCPTINQTSRCDVENTQGEKLTRRESVDTRQSYLRGTANHLSIYPRGVVLRCCRHT